MLVEPACGAALSMVYFAQRLELDSIPNDQVTTIDLNSTKLVDRLPLHQLA